jgi:hypothetical protein
MNKPARLHQRRLNLTAQPKSSLRHPLWPPSLLNPWWPCAATTALAKSAPKRLPGATADVMAVLESAVRAPGVTADQALAALATVALNAAATALAIAHPVKTEAHVWVMRLSARNGKPWSAPKCRCASWPLRRMARPWAV